MDVCLILIIQVFLFFYNNLICIKIDGKRKDEWGCKERRTESLCQVGSPLEVHHWYYVVCLLDCEQSLFSSKICKREYLSSEVPWVVRVQIRIRCSNTLPYRFSSKRETACSLYVFQCLQTFLLFSDRLNWRNNTTSNHELSFKMSGWPCNGINSGENNVQAWQVLYFGAREHLFIYSLTIFYTFVKLW